MKHRHNDLRIVIFFAILWLVAFAVVRVVQGVIAAVRVLLVAADKGGDEQ
ncbi:hypothetical protein [uncultured Ferrimonas sp.]|nr:hypothetical protein [uncultured Ferrimonas sp.]